MLIKNMIEKHLYRCVNCMVTIIDKKVSDSLFASSLFTVDSLGEEAAIQVGF